MYNWRDFWFAFVCKIVYSSDWDTRGECTTHLISVVLMHESYFVCEDYILLMITCCLPTARCFDYGSALHQWSCIPVNLQQEALENIIFKNVVEQFWWLSWTVTIHWNVSQQALFWKFKHASNPSSSQMKHIIVSKGGSGGMVLGDLETLCVRIKRSGCEPLCTGQDAEVKTRHAGHRRDKGYETQLTRRW